MVSIAPFILLQQQMEESVLEAEKKRKEENQKREDDYTGMTSCTRTTYKKVPLGVCIIYPSNMYCNILTK